MSQASVENPDRMPDDDMLSCIICESELRDPMLLKCLHNACSTCLDEKASISGNTNRITCSTCDVATDITRRIQNPLISEKIRNIAAQREVATCALCRQDSNKEVRADVFCIQCQMSLCVICLTQHNRHVKQHKCVSLDDTTNWSELLKPPFQLCKDHDAELSQVCFTCVQPVCIQCVKACYKGSHDVHLLNTPVVGQRLLKIKERIDHLIDALDGSKNILVTFTKLPHSLQFAYDIHLDLLKQAKKAVIDAISFAFDKAVFALKDSYDTLQEQASGYVSLAGLLMRRVSSATRYGRLFTSSGDAVGLLSQINDVESELSELKDTLSHLREPVEASRLVHMAVRVPIDMDAIACSWIRPPQLCTEDPCCDIDDLLEYSEDMDYVTKEAQLDKRIQDLEELAKSQREKCDQQLLVLQNQEENLQRQQMLQDEKEKSLTVLQEKLEKMKADFEIKERQQQQNFSLQTQQLQQRQNDFEHEGQQLEKQKNDYKVQIQQLEKQKADLKIQIEQFEKEKNDYEQHMKEFDEHLIERLEKQRHDDELQEQQLYIERNDLMLQQKALVAQEERINQLQAQLDKRINDPGELSKIQREEYDLQLQQLHNMEKRLPDQQVVQDDKERNLTMLQEKLEKMKADLEIKETQQQQNFSLQTQQLQKRQNDFEHDARQLEKHKNDYKVQMQQLEKQKADVKLQIEQFKKEKNDYELHMKEFDEHLIERLEKQRHDDELQEQLLYIERNDLMQQQKALAAQEERINQIQENLEKEKKELQDTVKKLEEELKQKSLQLKSLSERSQDQLQVLDEGKKSSQALRGKMRKHKKKHESKGEKQRQESEEQMQKQVDEAEKFPTPQLLNTGSEAHANPKQEQHEKPKKYGEDYKKEQNGKHNLQRVARQSPVMEQQRPKDFLHENERHVQQRLDQQAPLSFDSPSHSWQLIGKSWDVALTAEGHVLVAALDKGLREYDSSGKALQKNTWKPQGPRGEDECVNTVDVLEDGRVAVGLGFSKLIVLLQREAAAAGTNWVENKRISVLQSPPRRLSIHADILAVTEDRCVAGKWRPGSPCLTLLKLSSSLVLHRLELDYDVRSVAVLAQAVVTASHNPVKLSDGKEGFIVDGYSHAGERLWRQETLSRVVDICSTLTGHMIYLAGREGKITAINADKGDVSNDIDVECSPGLKKTYALSLARGKESFLVVLSRNERKDLRKLTLYPVRRSK